MVKLGTLLKVKLIHNKINKQINLSLSKKAFTKSIRERLSKSKFANIRVEEFE